MSAPSRIIFLDFDGVIVTAHDRFRRGDEWCVTLLNDITDRTGAEIVVTSAWRAGRSVHELQELLKEWGVTGKVLDKTPRLNTPRGLEIAKWLQERPTIESFVILDDDEDMGDLMPALVKCSFKHGLDQEEAEETVARLQKPTPRPWCGTVARAGGQY